MSLAPQSLADLEPYAVRALGGLNPLLLKRWAEDVRQRYVEVDLNNLRHRKAALQAIGAVFAFPRWYGVNLDALYDCLTEWLAAEDAPGVVILLKGFAQTSPREGLSAEDREELLDVFRDVATECAQNQSAALRVFYA